MLGSATLLAAGLVQAGPQQRRAGDDGTISRDDFKQMRLQVFEKLDANGEGYITARERDTLRESALRHHDDRQSPVVEAATA